MLVENSKIIRQYYQALLDRNSQYLGVFYVAVKTTNIFCIATCRARKPKLENIVFYTTAKEALLNGFRPCKVCRPTENVDEPPGEVKHVIKLISNNPEKKITDENLKTLGYRPEKIRRWFKKHHNMTFQAYQRMIRINMAYQSLRKGSTVTNSAFKSGYQSLSGFGYTFKSLLKTAPENANRIDVIYLNRFTTPLGPMFACATAKGVCLLEFTDRKMLEFEFKDLSQRLNAKIIAGKNEHLKNVEKQIEEYFAGSRHGFDIPLDTPGTEFQRKVWHHLQEIPFGVTRSYKQQALAVGRPKAIRAVASANGHNRVAIIIPCHRVIGSDGTLTGYGGGLPRKHWLLEHERKLKDSFSQKYKSEASPE